MKLLVFLLFAALSVDAVPLCSTMETEILDTGYEYSAKVHAFYKVYTDIKPYWSAWQQCDKDGGHLFIPSSDAEVQVVKDIVKKIPYEHDFFIGLHDFFQEGTFFTVEGLQVQKSSHIKWAKGEPNNEGRHGIENCVVFRPSGELNDVSCLYILPFICEIDAQKIMKPSPTSIKG